MSQPDRPDLAARLDALGKAALDLAEDLRNGLGCLRDEGPADARSHPEVSHPMNDLMTAQEVADALRIDVRTLRRKRHVGTAPKPLRGKGPLRWSRAAVLAWIEEHK